MIVFGLTILLVIVYMIVTYISQNNAESEWEANYSVAQNELKQAEEKFQKTRLEIFDIIAKGYGHEYSEEIVKRYIKSGMPQEFVMLSWGKPSEIKTNYSKGTKIEKWYFNPYYNRLGNLKHKWEVTLEDGFVSGWNEL